MAGVLSTLDALVDDTVDELLEAAILFNNQQNTSKIPLEPLASDFPN